MTTLTTTIPLQLQGNGDEEGPHFHVFLLFTLLFVKFMLNFP